MSAEFAAQPRGRQSSDDECERIPVGPEGSIPGYNGAQRTQRQRQSEPPTRACSMGRLGASRAVM